MNSLNITLNFFFIITICGVLVFLFIFFSTSDSTFWTRSLYWFIPRYKITFRKTIAPIKFFVLDFRSTIFPSSHFGHLTPISFNMVCIPTIGNSNILRIFHISPSYIPLGDHILRNLFQLVHLLSLFFHFFFGFSNLLLKSL